ncbi:MAG TPA: ATP-binding protein, partial [Candidatus Limnocylindrales bacterium]
PVVLVVPADLHPDDYWLAVQERATPDVACEIIVGSAGVRAQVWASSSTAVDEARVRDVASATAAPSGLSVASLAESWRSATQVEWKIDLELKRRGAMVTKLLAAAAKVAAVVEATAAGLTPETASAVIRAGHADALIGAQENEWLEVKSAPWDLATVSGKIELAQDVARFANANGGLLVVGATTHKQAGEDVIVRADGVRPDRLSLRRAQAVIDARVYPPIEGIELFTGPVSDSSNVTLLISIPPQPASLKPFVVHGAIVGRKVEGEFISIVRRRGEGSIPMGYTEIHAWLVAGRRLMLGERSPEQ